MMKGLLFHRPPPPPRFSERIFATSLEQGGGEFFPMEQTLVVLGAQLGREGCQSTVCWAPFGWIDSDVVFRWHEAKSQGVEKIPPGRMCPRCDQRLASISLEAGLSLSQKHRGFLMPLQTVNPTWPANEFCRRQVQSASQIGTKKHVVMPLVPVLISHKQGRAHPIGLRA